MKLDVAISKGDLQPPTPRSSADIISHPPLPRETRQNHRNYRITRTHAQLSESLASILTAKVGVSGHFVSSFGVSSHAGLSESKMLDAVLRPYIELHRRFCQEKRGVIIPDPFALAIAELASADILGGTRMSPTVQHADLDSSTALNSHTLSSEPLPTLA